MKKLDNKFFENEIVKLVSIIILTLLLIMVSLILFEDLDLDPSLLIYNIYGTLSLVSFLYSYHSSSKRLYNDLSLGISRRNVYKIYLKNIFFVLLVSLFFVSFYIFSYQFIIGGSRPLFDEFKIEIIVYLTSIFLSLSLFGFLLGILKLKRGFFYSIVLVITVMVVLSIIYYTIIYLLSILLGIIVIGLGILNYIILKNIKI
ncbi:MAG: hypothetical protein WC006_02990 [Bacilli bacterium]|nr:hypothetical protein [Bacilli bacterium]